MIPTDNGCDCHSFCEGDWVESKLNTDIIGIVVSDADFGRFVNVQLAGSLEIKPFHAVTLRHVATSAPAPAKAEDEPSNVVRVDFTQKREINNETKTVGEA